jgi:RNA polymerase sigma factor for flagellar operon FliA
MSFSNSVVPMPVSFTSEEPMTGVRSMVFADVDVEEHLSLVRQIALRMHRKLPRNVLLEDVVAAGTVGLMDALRRFEGERGEQFEWYARVRIRGAILDELRNLDCLSRRHRAEVRQQAATGQTGGGVVVIGFDDLPEQLRTPADNSQASPCDLVERSSENAALARAVETLPAREARIVSMHYFQGHAFKDIATTLNVSEPRVSQLHSRAVKMLRGIMGATANDCS